MSVKWMLYLVLLIGGLAEAAEEPIFFSGERRLNNLATDLLEATLIPLPSKPLTFTRSSDGWIFIVISHGGKGTVKLILDRESPEAAVMVFDSEHGELNEAMHYVTKGEHVVQLDRGGDLKINKLVIRAIPELIHCGLGFNSEIKAYGRYDWDFLKADILPHITTLIIPSNLPLTPSMIQDWHQQGKRFVVEAGVSAQAKTAEEHVKYWTSFFDKTPLLDGIIINEFIVNRPVIEWAPLTPERLTRMEQERHQYAACGEKPCGASMRIPATSASRYMPISAAAAKSSIRKSSAPILSAP